MTDDDLFFDFVERVQRKILNGCNQWIEPGVVPHSIEGAGTVFYFNAAVARRHDGVDGQVHEAVARVCT